MDDVHVEVRHRKAHWKWQPHGPGRTLRRRIRIEETTYHVQVKTKKGHQLSLTYPDPAPKRSRDNQGRRGAVPDDIP